MHLRSSLMIFLAIVATLVAAVLAAEVNIPIENNEEAVLPSVKLDKNLRRALLKALADLEAESAEEERENERDGGAERVEETVIPTTVSGTENPTTTIGVKIDSGKNLSNVGKTTFSFNGFLGEGETPNEEKLQNSSFIEIDKYTFSTLPSTQQLPPNHSPAITNSEESKSTQIHDLVTAEKSSALYLKNPLLVNDDLGKDYQETRSIKNSGFSVNSVQSVSSKPITQLQQNDESLSRSASSNIVSAVGNSLISPKPTASSLTVTSKSENGSLATSSTKTDVSKNGKLEDKQEVKIFQAPLVAAFTVQQDERGVPKSVVPIYRTNGDGQALTLQEQLEFKQRQLEQQLAELQRQQVQQTQFLARQQQLYEEQLRFKQQQQQQIYLNEQARLKQLEEQRIYQHQIQQQQQQQRLQQASFDQNSLISLQPPFDKPVIQFEPSISLQLPNIANPPLFQAANYQDQLRLQQFQQEQQLLQQQRQRQRQQQEQQQQILQQSFGAFPITEFKSPVVTLPRFNRQEVFGSTGNFGFNQNNNNNDNNNQFNSRNNFRANQFNTPLRNNQNFAFDNFNQFRQARPHTPAKQIQHLLYQSGVASDLGTVRGSGGAEDLNIVSKVLALNVGAIPSNSLQFGESERASSFSKTPNSA